MTDLQNKSASPKKNPLLSLGGGFSKWFGMLTGKGTATPTPKTNETTEAKKDEPPEEDSVAEDMKKAKAFFDQTMAKLGKSAAPTLAKGKQFEGKSVDYAKKVVDVNFTKRVVRIFMILFFGLILLFVANRIFKLVGNNGNPPNVATPTTAPTVPPFQRTEPSIYAKDSLILKIEEDAKVLVNEIIGKNLDDDSLSPPDVDLNINFLR